MATMKCGRCGSAKVMSDLRIRDRYEAGVGQKLRGRSTSEPECLNFQAGSQRGVESNCLW